MAYEGVVAGGSASAGFEAASSSNSDIKDTKTSIHMEGQDLGYSVPLTDTAGAMKVVYDFPKYVNKGTGQATILMAYRTHNDFI